MTPTSRDIKSASVQNCSPEPDTHNENPLISVIICAYKVGTLLADCLTSILDNTYENLEVLVVEDGPDVKDSALIDYYVSLDPRVKHLRHDQNRGLFQSRLTGMAAAHGDWICFVDGDDKVSKDWFRTLIRKGESSGADIVIGDTVELIDDRLWRTDRDQFSFTDISLTGTAVFAAFMGQWGWNHLWHTVWNKLYRAALVQECIEKWHLLGEGGRLIMCEDIAFSSVLWGSANQVTNTHGAWYFYRRHNEASTSAVTSIEALSGKLDDIARVFTFFAEYLSDHDGSWDLDFTEWKKTYAFWWFGHADSLPSNADRELARRMVLDALGMASTPDPIVPPTWFLAQRTDVTQVLSEWEQVIAWICDPETRVVSFDVFDTLILRPFWQPEDLWALLGQDFGKACDLPLWIDFPRLRRESDAYRRRQLAGTGLEDITLSEIYEEFGRKYSVDADTCRTVMQRECDYESAFSRPRLAGRQLYEIAEDVNKTIVFVSDMYLDEDTVQGLLASNGYAGPQLFLSSKERLLKATGNLFDEMMDQYGVRPQNVVHIGDNPNNDVFVPKSKGMRAFHIPKPTAAIDWGSHANWLRAYSDRGLLLSSRTAIDSPGSHIALGMAANRCWDRPWHVDATRNSMFSGVPSWIGYAALGPHLYAMTNDLIERSQSFSNVVFCSRDGWLPKMAFDYLASARGLDIPSEYVRVSRRSMTRIWAAKRTSWLALTGLYLQPRAKTPVSILASLKGLLVADVDDLAARIWDAGFQPDSPFPDHDSMEAFLGLAYDIFIDHQAVDAHAQIAKHYYEQWINKDSLVFEIGYSGRVHDTLSRLLGRPVDGYCLYLEQDALARSAADGFKLYQHYTHSPHLFAPIRELVFSEPIGECTGYELQNGIPVALTSSTSVHTPPQKWVIEQIQSAAMEYVRDRESAFYDHNQLLRMRGLDAAMIWEYLLHTEVGPDVDLWSCFESRADTYVGVPSDNLMTLSEKLIQTRQWAGLSE